MSTTVSSSFTYSGTLTATLNSLTNATNVTSLNLSNLSTANYPSGSEVNNSAPNSDNQEIFMNQPMSWWLNALNNKTVIYTPVSNFVNWSYKDANGHMYHIGMPISNMLIPNSCKTSTTDNTTHTTSMVFNEKFGMGRTDVRTYSMPGRHGATGATGPRA
jgi:hypothetical protein